MCVRLRYYLECTYICLWSELCDCQCHSIQPFLYSPFLVLFVYFIGYNLLHSLLRWEPPCSSVVSVVQFLLAQKECKSLLLQKATVRRDYEATPLQQAKGQAVSSAY